MSVHLGSLQAEHTFMVFDDLSTSVILSCDFLMKRYVTIDFGKTTASCNKLTLDEELPQAIPTASNCSQQASFD